MTKLLKADHLRRVEIPGVPVPVRRPVDIDKTQSAFANLRSLRIYCFDEGSVINGHAEEDEVLIVVLAGSVDLTISESEIQDSSRPFLLSAASDSHSDTCAAYLPPHAAYRLTPRGNAEVGYARATPPSGRSPTVFKSQPSREQSGITVLLQENGYPQRLRMRLAQITASQQEIACTPIEHQEESCEALIHFRTIPAERGVTLRDADGRTTALESWDTVAVAPGDRPTVRVALGSSALILVVLAE